MKAAKFCLFLGWILLCASGGTLLAADYEWPQFLGPTRNGVSAEKGLADAWPASGPKELWRVDGGVGKSGLAISRGKVVTLVQVGGKQRLIAVDAKTGAKLWHADLTDEFQNPMGNGPRGTPAIHGEQVFALTGDGTLAAVGFGDGRVQWTKEVLADLGGKVPEYGIACSPLIVGSTVVVTLGAERGTVAAYDVKTGERQWAAGSDPAGYSSPALLQVGGRAQIVACTGSSILGLDPKAGDVLWRYPYVTDYECNIATPLAVAGQVFVSSGENHGSTLLALKAAGSKFDVAPAWESLGPKSSMRNEWQTSVLLDGHLYGLDNVGGAGPVTHLNCVNAATGERVWQQTRFGKGNLIAADGKLYFSMLGGELIMVRATPKAYEELGRFDAACLTRQAPALANGLLYLRDDKKIICYDVRKAP